MSIPIREISLKSFEDKFFDMYDKDFSRTTFTDYRYLNREIIIADNKDGNFRLELGENKNRKRITSIDELRSDLKELIIAVLQIYETVPIFHILEPSSFLGDKRGLAPLHEYPFYFDYSHLNKDLLADQLVFDILFDKYIAESEKMTRRDYSIKLNKRLHGNKLDESEAIRRKIERAMKTDYDMMKHPQLREELEQLGINLVKYEEYFTPVAKDNVENKKPKFIWDYFYYNRSMITYRQFRRQIKRDGNYSTEEFVRDLNEYNEFVEKILPIDNESPIKYFNMSMDYYYLESYKRIDYILKLINSMPQKELKGVDKENFLVKRFPFPVLVPYEKNNELSYGRGYYKYYRPLFYIEEELRQQARSYGEFNYGFYADTLYKYYLVRAKTYELFKYHAEYISSDYRDIKNYIRDKYDMRSYHESSGIWGKNEKKEKNEWKKMNDKTKQQMQMITRNFITISNALFWESPKRKIHKTSKI